MNVERTLRLSLIYGAVVAVLIAIAVWLGPFIKRFGRAYAADVFHDNPLTGKSYIVLTDIGKEQMDHIRSLSAELLAHETRRLQQGRDDVDRTLLLSRIGIAALSIVGLLALFTILRKGVLLYEQQQS